MRLHLVDGTYELYRAHYSKRPDHAAPDGQDVKATAGLTASMLALLHDASEAVSHIGIAFDHPIRSFRNDLYGGYKSDEGVPPELAAQFTLAEEAAQALGMVTWRMDRWEADDALATAAARWSTKCEQVRILSPDKDLGQCVRGQKIILVNRRLELEIDEVALHAKFGVRPSSIPDYLALVGDEADGIPGLEGFGARGAATLLEAYGHLEAIPADPTHWKVKPRGAERLARTLIAQRKDALLYRELATLVTDVPLAESLEELAWLGVPRGPFEDFCEKLGLRSLRSRPTRWRS